MNKQSEDEMLLKWCNGNQSAADMLSTVYRVSQIADDFVDNDIDDKDKSRKMTEMLHLLLVVLPLNPFFNQYKDWLIPVINSSVIIWDATNDWAYSPHVNDRVFAYVYREIAEQIAVMTAFLIGGLEHSRKVLREIQQHYHSTDKETLIVWMQDIVNRTRR